MISEASKAPAVWFLAVRAETGSDVFTIRLADALEKRGIRAQIFWLPHRAEFLPWTALIPKAPRWATVVHINSWLHRRFIPSHLPVVVTLHSCVHDAALNPYKSFLQKLYHRSWIWRMEKEAIRRADAITAVSEYTARQAEKVFSCIDVIPIHNWVDTRKFGPSSQDRSRNSPFRLLYVGSMSRRKGVDLFPAIMRALGPEYELHFTGALRDLGGAAQEQSNLISIGRLKSEAELVAVYQGADALLFPTRLEGFGLVALEAQSCGLPVIATRGSSLPEVIEDGVTGSLCAADDVMAFVTAIRRLRNNQSQYEAMKVAARLRAENVFSEDRAIKKYLAVYRSV